MSFYITIENHDVVLHNFLVDSGATNNIIPFSVMEELIMGCTKYYETSESIYVIDSRQVPTYGEIKDFYVWITTNPHIVTVCGQPSFSIWSCVGKILDLHDQWVYNE